MADRNDGGGFAVKKARHEKILELIRENTIGTQDELVDKLREAGYDVSQATISRDIKDLRLQKAAASSGYRYVLPEEKSDGVADERLQTIFGKSVLSVDYAGNLVVIKTMAALGSAACAAVDGMQHDYIVGTLAGDDTGLIIVRSEQQARELCEQLETLIED